MLSAEPQCAHEALVARELAGEVAPDPVHGVLQGFVREAAEKVAHVLRELRRRQVFRVVLVERRRRAVHGGGGTASHLRHRNTFGNVVRGWAKAIPPIGDRCMAQVVDVELAVHVGPNVVYGLYLRDRGLGPDKAGGVDDQGVVLLTEDPKGIFPPVRLRYQGDHLANAGFYETDPVADIYLRREKGLESFPKDPASLGDVLRNDDVQGSVGPVRLLRLVVGSFRAGSAVPAVCGEPPSDSSGQCRIDSRECPGADGSGNVGGRGHGALYRLSVGCVDGGNAFHRNLLGPAAGTSDDNGIRVSPIELFNDPLVDVDEDNRIAGAGE